MSEKSTCPACESHTSAIRAALREDEPCPYCGADLATGKMPSVSLTEFLLARISEDEAEAQREIDDGYGTYKESGWPATRVVAECEAKRRIVALWADVWDEWHGHGSGLVRTRMTDDQYLMVLTAERVLGFLALPHADHADYDEVWRP